MKLTCNQATTICDKSQYKEATFWELLKLNLHIFLCKKCKKYANQNSIMSKCYNKQRSADCTKNDCLCDEEKTTMESNLKEKL
ncbi:hypothetical protein [Lutibacter sp.]|uniref:hypothetical protein n=1 Tax=Lutibacter sp. TaxID=1925666 RepID=UPI0034A06A90